MKLTLRGTVRSAAESNSYLCVITRGNEMSDRELPNSNDGLHQHFPTIRCPHCKVRWLAPGMRRGEVHLCKECGLSFVIGKPKDQTSQPPVLISQTEETNPL